MDDVFKKMKVKAGMKGAIANAPSEYENMTPENIILAQSEANPDLDFALLFVKDKLEIDQHFLEVAKLLKSDGMLWIAYPKKTSGIKTDINRDRGWDTAKEMGYQPVAQVAIDNTWSALRFRHADFIGS